MEGVTTALVGFIFVCVVYPQLVKNRPQFYAAFAFICGIILLDGIGEMISPSPVAAFRVFVYAAVSVMQVCAILLFFLAAGGITWKELAGDMSHAFEVIRRGGEKEVIIPLTGAQPKARAAREEPPRERIVMNSPLPPTSPAAKSPPSNEKIPLD
jgi:hypothetical protein